MVETQYDDAITVAAVVATAEIVGVSVDDALRAYGGFFVKAVHAGDHNRLFLSLLVSTALRYL